MGYELPWPPPPGLSLPPGTDVHPPNPPPTPSLTCLGQENMLRRLAEGGGLVFLVGSWSAPSCFIKTCRCREGSGDKLCRFVRTLLRGPFPIQPASLPPGNAPWDSWEGSHQGSQVPPPPSPHTPLPPFAPPPPEDLQVVRAVGNTEKR